MRADGQVLIFAPSKPTVFAERILKHVALAGYFCLIVGSNLDHTHVSRAEVIHHVLDDCPDLNGQRVVMVGEREHDINGDPNNGRDTIAGSFGSGPMGELLAVGSTYLVLFVRELADLLEWQGEGCHPRCS
ncbi:MAG: hypothetical protein M3Q71_04410 [Chloroflexota bacterium]|nr:hypothetical protein [Chloroflexota bacterium]